MTHSYDFKETTIFHMTFSTSVTKLQMWNITMIGAIGTKSFLQYIFDEH